MNGENKTKEQLIARVNELRERLAKQEAILEQKRQAEERITHLNAVLNAIRNVNQLIITGQRPENLIQAICGKLIETRGYYNAWIALFDSEGNLTATAEAGLGESFLPMVKHIRSAGLGDCGAAVMKRKGVEVVEDPAATCTGCPLANRYTGNSGMRIRLEHGGSIYGILTVSIPRELAFDDEEHELFEEVAGDIGLALYNLDIEEKRKQAEKEREKLREQLNQAQKMEAIGVLAGGVAHDFNNLLTTIIGHADLALMDLREDTPVYHSVEQMRKAGQRAASLTRQLLAFSRKQTIQPEIVNLNDILMESEKMLRRLIGEDIDFLTVYEQEPWHVYVDTGQVDQVVMNLVVNARDAMPKGGKLTIETANVELDEVYFHEHGVESAPGQYVMVAVTDTGIGMDRETQSRIFEPFFTTKGLGRGTGLGLSTAFGIVKQNNGHIWVYSEPGEGTTFKVYLPRSEKQGETSGQEELPLSQIRGTESILLVEDDDQLRALAERMLQVYGYTVLLARDGEEALKVEGNYPDAIHLLLTDVVMPRMDGKDLAENMQSKRPDMKVLFMSGYTDNAIAHHGVLDKDLSFIQKPFTASSLARKVREILDQ